MGAFHYSGLSTSEASQIASHEYGSIFVEDGSTPQGLVLQKMVRHLTTLHQTTQTTK
jgi:hypothetical protein